MSLDRSGMVQEAIESGQYFSKSISSSQIKNVLAENLAAAFTCSRVTSRGRNNGQTVMTLIVHSLVSPGGSPGSLPPSRDLSDLDRFTSSRIKACFSVTDVDLTPEVYV